MTDTATGLAGSRCIQLDDTRQLFGSAHALPVLRITHPRCEALLLLQGAQLLQFRPTGERPWLWLSPQARFEPGHAPRGGIPVCLPWFGVRQEDPTQPKHGFARNRDWQLQHREETPEAVTLVLGFHYDGSEPALFRTAFRATLTLRLSATLEMALRLQHEGTMVETFSWALHSYLAVDDCTRARVSGLEGIRFLDNTRGLEEDVSDDAVRFQGEVDRVYCRTTQPQILQHEDALIVDGEHCPTCIVWNAGPLLARDMPDIGDHYHHYVCVERGCAFDDRLQLAPGEAFEARMHLRPAPRTAT